MGYLIEEDIYMRTRDIDEEIATKIMGWKRSDKQPSRWVTPEGLLSESYYAPTSDISRAFEALGKLSSEYDYSVERVSEEFCVEIYNDERSYCMIGDSIPFIICLALLKYHEDKKSWSVEFKEDAYCDFCGKLEVLSPTVRYKDKDICFNCVESWPINITKEEIVHNNYISAVNRVEYYKQKLKKIQESK